MPPHSSAAFAAHARGTRTAVSTVSTMKGVCAAIPLPLARMASGWAPSPSGMKESVSRCNSGGVARQWIKWKPGGAEAEASRRKCSWSRKANGSKPICTHCFFLSSASSRGPFTSHGLPWPEFSEAAIEKQRSAGRNTRL
eukprot:scaffold92634_cov29-Tisochrysis_lutea.AAC.1